MSVELTFLIAVLAVVFVFEAYIRLAPSNPDIWHVDPLAASRPQTPNSFLQRPEKGKYPSQQFDLSATDLAHAFDLGVMSESRTRRLAGAPDDLFVTYIARSRLFGFPDYVSIRFVPLGAKRSTYAVFSRARFGYGDRGVNRRRLLGWLNDIAPQ